MFGQRGPLLLVTLAVLLDTMGFGLIAPVLPTHVSELGKSPDAILAEHVHLSSERKAGIWQSHDGRCWFCAGCWAQAG